MNKETRDVLRAAQRHLRDDFQGRAMQLERSAYEAMEAARRLSELDETQLAARERELQTREGQLESVRAAAAGGGRRPGAGGQPWLTPWSTTLTSLLDRAVASARTDDVRARLVEARDRLSGPLRLAIAGKVKAGKSTLLNAILGDELAPTDAGECTKIVTWYREGNTPQVTVYPLERSTG